MAEISLELIGRRLDAIQTEFREFKFAVDVDRREAVSWRNSLVSELGAKLATFELRIDNRLAQMDERLTEMDERLTHKIDKADERLAQMGERLAQMDGKLANIEALLQQLLAK
jgi:predicted  nucleic acid-binding Zn-ribbon protein